jgi:hypothetical protein
MLPIIIGAVSLIAYGLFDENSKPKAVKKMAKGGNVKSFEETHSEVLDYLAKHKFTISAFGKDGNSIKVDDREFGIEDQNAIEKINPKINVSGSSNSNIWYIFMPNKMAKGGDVDIVRNPNKNSFEDMINWYFKNNETPISKGDLMRMAYDDTKGVDSAIPQSIVGELDDTFFYVYDYQNSTFGELVDLRIKLKFSNVKVDVTIVVDGEVVYKDSLPSELQNATFHQALKYVFKHDEVEAFSIRPKQMMAKGGSLKAKKKKDYSQNRNPELDKKYMAEKKGTRVSQKVAQIERRDGTIFKRRNANQYGRTKGGNTYVENRDNRSDKRVFLEKGGEVDTWENILVDYGFKKSRTKLGVKYYKKRGYFASVDNRRRIVELYFDDIELYSGYSIQGLIDELEKEFKH